LQGSRSRKALLAPVHELRGAVTALELGLSFAERNLRSEADLNGNRPRALAQLGACLVALRGPLARAALAVEELDSYRDGERYARREEAAAWIDVTGLLLGRARLWARMAPAYGARLELSWVGGRVTLRGDAEGLARAFDNLLANALEHGGRDALVEAEVRGTTLHVIISDGGPGLPAAEGKVDGRPPGRGHGLRIAREIIERHNGKLDPGIGARGPGVVVELPVRLERTTIQIPSRTRREALSMSSEIDLEASRAA